MTPRLKLQEFKVLQPDDAGRRCFVMAELAKDFDEEGEPSAERIICPIPGCIMSVESGALAVIHFDAPTVTLYRLATEMPGGDLLFRVPIRYLRYEKK